MFGGPSSTHSTFFDCPSLALALCVDLSLGWLLGAPPLTSPRAHTGPQGGFLAPRPGGSGLAPMGLRCTQSQRIDWRLFVQQSKLPLSTLPHHLGAPRAPAEGRGDRTSRRAPWVSMWLSSLAAGRLGAPASHGWAWQNSPSG